MNLGVFIDPRVPDATILEVIEEVERTFGKNWGMVAEVKPLDDETDVSVILTDVPGTYDSFPERVKTVLSKFDVLPERIRVEVTPSSDEWE